PDGQLGVTEPADEFTLVARCDGRRSYRALQNGLGRPEGLGPRLLDASLLLGLCLGSGAAMAGTSGTSLDDREAVGALVVGAGPPDVDPVVVNAGLAPVLPDEGHRDVDVVVALGARAVVD